jgi:FkbM family methyltransferase
MLVYYLGTFEPHCLEIMRRLIGKGDVVIDVGANVGLYTIEASRLVGDVGRVLAVEPVPQHVESLRRSLDANHMSNVEVMVTAAGDSSGTAALGRGENSNLGMYSVGHGTPRDRMEVTLSRIDDIVQQRGLSKVDLVKLDIEGAEYRALCGMLETLASHKPTLLIELNEEAMARCETTSLAVKDMLRDLGYRGWRVSRRGLQRLDDSMRRHTCDECLFVHSTRRDAARRLELS